MKAVVIGATGHIGTYLVPMLVRAGYSVTAVSRGTTQPYEDDPAWQQANRLVLERAAQDFEQRIAAEDAEVVIDLIAFAPEEVASVATALRGTRLQHYLVASTIWSIGRVEHNPVTEDHPRAALDDYGRAKTAIEELIVQQWRERAFPGTVVLPGQISGPGWDIISPLGNIDREVFQTIADGEAISLPNFGMEELHHIHGYDVAQVFFAATQRRTAALGEVFHAVADEGLTTYGYALGLYRFFGRTPQISFLGWERWVQECGLSEELIEASYLHLARSGHFTNAKARSLLGFVPRYSTWQTVKAAVSSYLDRGLVRVNR